MQEIDISGVRFPIRCKKCFDGKFYLGYRCSGCNLSQFEGFEEKVNLNKSVQRNGNISSLKGGENKR